jgi:hypothetical protein
MKNLLLTLFIGVFCHFMANTQEPMPKKWFYFGQDETGESKIVYPLTGNTTLINQGIVTLNYNPVLMVMDTFSGVSFSDVGNAGKTILLVAKPIEIGREYQLWSSERGGRIDNIFTNRRVADLQRFRYINFSQAHTKGPSIFSFFDSGEVSTAQASQDGSICIAGQANADSLPIGRFKGELAECLLFDRVISPDELAQSESYLAIKYGITRRGNYLLKSGQIMWNWKENKVFNHEIFGLARSDAWQLHQKQAETPLLQLGLSSINKTNSLNRNIIKNDACLLIGNDNGLTFFDKTYSDSISYLSRTWLATTNGIDSAIQLCFSKGELAERASEEDEYVLLINRKGDKNFNKSDTELFFSNKEELGHIYFNQVFFDPDQSGKDIFTLGVKHNGQKNKPLLNNQFESVEIWPNPSFDGYFKVSVKANETDALYYQIVDTSGKIIETGQKGSSNRFFFEVRLPVGSGYYLNIYNNAAQATKLLYSPN